MFIQPATTGEKSMQTTPLQLSIKPNVMHVVAPDYDFEEQTRGVLMAGKYTARSIQTYNSQGKPNDSQSDSND